MSEPTLRILLVDQNVMRASILTLLAYLAVLVFALPFLWAVSLSIRPVHLGNQR